MAVGSVLIGLQASFKSGRGVTTSDFLTPLNIQALDQVEATRATGTPWASGMVYFPVIRLSEVAHEPEPVEAFFVQVKRVFLIVAAFFDRRSTDIFNNLRATVGLSLRVFIEVRMDQDQMELELPPKFVAACGRHHLGMYVISNDIPAAEVLV